MSKAYLYSFRSHRNAQNSIYLKHDALYIIKKFKKNILRTERVKFQPDNNHIYMPSLNSEQPFINNED